MVAGGELTQAAAKRVDDSARAGARVHAADGWLAARVQRMIERFIGRDVARPLNEWVNRRIFPGAYPPTLAEVTRGILAPGGMSVIDVENLRLRASRNAATLVDSADVYEPKA
jgi:cyclopropane fatty-acyl-phospholipid synthase-like methyltransferase